MSEAASGRRVAQQRQRPRGGRLKGNNKTMITLATAIDNALYNHNAQTHTGFPYKGMAIMMIIVT